MKIQLDIEPELNKALKIFKAQNGLGNLQEAVIQILKEKFKSKSK